MAGSVGKNDESVDNEMILQTFILPSEVCQEQNVYYRTEGCVRRHLQERNLVLKKGSMLASNTYMNLFDVSIWKQYTEIRNYRLMIELAGRGKIELWSRQDDGEVLRGKYVYNADEKEKIEIPLNGIDRGQIYFKVIPWLETVFYKAEYECEDLPQSRLMSLVICTYKREEQLKHNIEKILQSKFWDEESELYHKLFVRVVDNASELQLPVDDNFKLYHNPNTGGSGGFTRGIVETQKDKDKFNTTHIILMDDDVGFEIETLYRIHALLSYIKPDYENEVIAGRMFRQDDKKIQYTASEIWNGGNIIHCGANLDCNVWEDLKNINEQRGEYTGWWLAVFPYEFTVDNLPLPFFLHCDDVEYGLRHGGQPIVLNGIQVWHETYEYRQSPVIAYYDYRNTLIVNAMYGLLPKKEEMLHQWKQRISEQHVKQNYHTERMLILAMKDFLRGEKWFQEIDSGYYHKKLKATHYFKIRDALLWRLCEKKIKLSTKGE